MKNSPLLAAPLAFAFLCCVPLQAANQPAGRGVAPSPSGVHGSEMGSGKPMANPAIQVFAPGIAPDAGTSPTEVDDNTLAFDMIPEPTAAALGAVGLILLLRVRRA